jgi:hypothetical protein
MSVVDAGDQLLFVAVGRLSDKAFLGSWVAKSVEYQTNQFVGAVREVVNSPGFKAQADNGARVYVAASSSALCITTDDVRFYAVVTTSDYPQRLAFPMLDEVAARFIQNSSLVSKYETCKEFGLNKKFKKLVAEVVDEYNDPAKKDKLSAVQQKVDAVKLQMHSNINGMLRNIDKTEQMEKDAQDLENGAKVFQKTAGDLQKRELWKSRKLTLIIAAIIAIIITILIITLVKG